MAATDAFQPPSSPPARILVRGVNWLGDAVMTVPALQRLRERFPEARITLLTPEKLAGLWSGHPAIDDVLTFAAGDSAMTVGARLRAGKFDLGIALPNSARSAWELWFGGIPRRVGYAGGGRSLLLTSAVPRRPCLTSMRKRPVAEIKELILRRRLPGPPAHDAASHHLHHYLHLVAALGCSAEPLAPFVAVRDSELKSMQERLGLLELSGARVRLFGLNPGAEYGPAKRWPREQFVAAGIELHKRTGCRWVIFGGAADTGLAAGIAAQIHHAARRHAVKHGDKSFPVVINLAGQTTLRELCAALKACDAVLTNDTGPMHLAAAVGTPVVVPFGSTSPELTGPGAPGDPRHHLLKSNAPCSPCFLRECPIDFRCMKGITVERVAEAMLRAAKFER